METCLGWVLSRRATTDYTNNNAVENVMARQWMKVYIVDPPY